MRRLILILCLTLATPALPASEPSRLTAAAREQVRVTVFYDPDYTRLDFPGAEH